MCLVCALVSTTWVVANAQTGTAAPQVPMLPELLPETANQPTITMISPSFYCPACEQARRDLQRDYIDKGWTWKEEVTANDNGTYPRLVLCVYNQCFVFTPQAPDYYSKRRFNQWAAGIVRSKQTQSSSATLKFW